jgi:hypothetical protein
MLISFLLCEREDEWINQWRLGVRSSSVKSCTRDRQQLQQPRSSLISVTDYDRNGRHGEDSSKNESEDTHLRCNISSLRIAASRCLVSCRASVSIYAPHRRMEARVSRRYICRCVHHAHYWIVDTSDCLAALLGFRPAEYAGEESESSSELRHQHRFTQTHTTLWTLGTHERRMRHRFLVLRLPSSFSVVLIN